MLRDHDDRRYPSRVEDLGPGTITVARPFDLPAGPADVPSPDLLVTWGCARGIAVLPTRLAGAHDEGDLRLWSLAVTGDGWIEQRRHFVRVPASGPLTLRPRVDPGAETVSGHLLDLSEAALRCTVDGDAARSDVAVNDTEVIAGFSLGEREFAIPARIGCRRSGGRPAEHVELVVVFDAPVREADVLRKQIYARQLRALRSRSGGFGA